MKKILGLLLLIFSFSTINIIQAKPSDPYSPENIIAGIDPVQENIFEIYLSFATIIFPLFAIGLYNILKKKQLTVSSQKIILLFIFIVILLVEILMHIGYLIVENNLGDSFDYISFFTSILLHGIIIFIFGNII